MTRSLRMRSGQCGLDPLAAPLSMISVGTIKCLIAGILHAHYAKLNLRKYAVATSAHLVSLGGGR